MKASTRSPMLKTEVKVTVARNSSFVSGRCER